MPDPTRPADTTMEWAPLDATQAMPQHPSWHAQPPHRDPQPVYSQPPHHGYDTQAPTYAQHRPDYVAQVYGQYPQPQSAATTAPHGFAVVQQTPYFAMAVPPAAADDAADGSGGAAGSDDDGLRSRANATAGISNRVRFIRLTYLHLLLAICAFAGLEYLLMTNPFLVAKISLPFTTFALGPNYHWGIVLGVFMAVSWIADYWASHATSRVTQYAGLIFYVMAEAVIFVPLLAIVAFRTHEILARGGHDPNIIRDSAYVTLALFGALTASVFLTKKDFSFMRSGLFMASGAAMMLIVMSLTFGFNLGLVFSVAMVFLAAGYILYQTSQVLAHYNPNQYVAASLALFSSVALMFWYVIRIFLRSRN